MIEFTLNRKEDSTYLMVLLTTRRRARDLKVLMFHHLLYYHNSILRIFRVKESCIVYVKRLRRHIRSSYYITYSEYKWSNNKELPDYVFLTKEGD